MYERFPSTDTADVERIMFKTTRKLQKFFLLPFPYSFSQPNRLFFFCFLKVLKGNFFLSLRIVNLSVEVIILYKILGMTHFNFQCLTLPKKILFAVKISSKASLFKKKTFQSFLQYLWMFVAEEISSRKNFNHIEPSFIAIIISKQLAKQKSFLSVL